MMPDSTSSRIQLRGIGYPVNEHGHPDAFPSALNPIDMIKSSTV